jgi:hypothetical protein
MTATVFASLLLALAVATPATAQLGLKKKLKAAATGENASPAAAAGAEPGGALVLDDEVVERIIKGLRAGKAHRESAARADTPYGRHLLAKAAYAEARSKCEAGAQTLVARMTANPKLGDRNGIYLERMMAAQRKGDTTTQKAWGDSIAVIQDPACVVKDPQQPDDWYDQQRAVESGADSAELKASGLDGRESGQAKDRAIAIIRDAPPPDLSPSEQQAVDKREKELKDLMNLNPPPEARTPKPAPAAAAPPPQPTPTMTPGQQAASDCMMKNSKKHEKEIAGLGEKMQAASQANDMERVMALADSLQRLQTAGCNQ